jgi:hypothetical protein
MREDPGLTGEERAELERLRAEVARQGLTDAVGWLAGGAEHAGLGTGPVGRWVEASKRVLRITAVAVAALALGFWGRPSGKVVLGLTLALLVTLAIIEFPARPAPRSDAVSTPT